MAFYVLDFQKIGKTDTSLVGGKGANLGELSKLEGIHVPQGFCITTKAYKDLTGNSVEFNSLLAYLTTLHIDNKEEIIKTSTRIRKVIEKIAIPEALEKEITLHLEQMGSAAAYAVRSSGTAEDLQEASFAGQQDTYLNVFGKEEILKSISRCWASLYTERAIIYRLQNGFDHRKVYLSVVIQKMIFPEVSGILFTADPVSSNRKIVSIDASFGLGEAMVSGIVNADNYKVRQGQIIEKKISSKMLAVLPANNGGTEEQEVQSGLQNTQSLSDAEIIELERLGRKIEAHFGEPQDIEWCLYDHVFYFVQSRPITTLFPIPQTGEDENHVYVSVGHQQMMTDAMKPLGLSFFLLTTPAPMRTAGGRLFVDITPMLASSAGGQKLADTLGKSDPLIKDALTTILKREDFISLVDAGSAKTSSEGLPLTAAPTSIQNNPGIVSELIKNSELSIEELRQNIKNKSGGQLADFILEDIQRLKQILFDPQSHRVISAAMDASSWINEKMAGWLGEKNAADQLSQSVDNNVTSEMGLALLDVADVIRTYPEVIEYLSQTKDNNFRDRLAQYNGGQKSLNAINEYLSKYGMRCPGEIDITTSRWSEKPLSLVSIILGNVKNFEHGASRQKFEKGRQEALKKEKDLLERLRLLPDGQQKVHDTKQQIDILRNFIGYREYPKYGLVNRYFLYKKALLKEAERLKKANILSKKEDIYYLTFEELHEVLRTNVIDTDLVNKRKGDYKSYKKLTPPRLMTSDGEIINGDYERENFPSDALIGFAVSSGIVEGRARVVLKIEDANIEDGDILITSFTDPSWTPLFVSIKGLITEVGGLMTHGAVIAREYGLPAVVGIESATKRFKDGQKIRLNGTEGFVEILPS